MILLFTSALLLSFAVLADDPNELTAKEKRQGWALLFDGETTDGWRGWKKDHFPEKGWTIEDGVLMAKGEGGGDIMTEKKYEDFELVMDWKIEEGGNSGLLFHVLESDQYKSSWNTAPEIQIIDHKGYKHNLKPAQIAGANYDLHPPKKDVAKPAGEWNTFRIKVKDGHVQHWLNGKKVVDYQIGSEGWKKKVEDSKFAKFPGYGLNEEGHIAIQDHGSKAWFKNIKIREL